MVTLDDSHHQIIRCLGSQGLLCEPYFAPMRSRRYLLSHSGGTSNPLPADAVAIPADGRGTFHLPPAADTCRHSSALKSDGIVSIQRDMVSAMRRCPAALGWSMSVRALWKYGA